ncbi:hypothetical protein [Brevibacterium aurantiacum]|uniref:Lipoprotein n=1 Tax=Brevibacterium aurantiacum TaxID=273384 RepID=A0A556C4U7_BREAU|nr:hypothetical protein [Brevibacterium aurantiacum]TSI12421.1 hypothetical protein FO013_20000 [Brevibacterium aurantiacum]
MKKLASIVGGLALLTGSSIVAAPAMAASEGGIEQVASAPVSEDDRIDALLADGAEADPLELVPGATTDPAKIAKIDESGAPATVVVDPDNGEIVAAKVESGISALKITSVGPGCDASAGHFCMRGANSYGFRGTGTLNATWKGISWYHTGNKQGRVKISGKWDGWQPKNRAVQLTKKVTVTGISRE